MTQPSIAALVSERTDPVSGRATRNRNDALTVTLGLRLAAQRLRLFHAGSMSESVARDYLALGAPTLDILETRSDDPVPHLAAALGQAQLILAGTQARDRFGSGVLPYALAAALGRPLVGDVIDCQADGPSWFVIQALPKGARRRLRVTGPAVLAISATADWPLRHAHAARMAGHIARHPVATGSEAPAPLRVPAARRIVPLAAVATTRGADRMHAAVGGADAARGVGGANAARGVVISSGSPEDKARAVLDYLRQHALIDF